MQRNKHAIISEIQSAFHSPLAICAAKRETCHMFLSLRLPFFSKIRLKAVIVMVIHSCVAMVKSISPPPVAAAECISLMRCLQPVCRAAAASSGSSGGSSSSSSIDLKETVSTGREKHIQHKMAFTAL